jgi:hypothetical protein
MNQIKTLADQLRDRMAKPDTPLPEEKPVIKKKAAKAEIVPPIVEQLRAYDLNDHKSMVHVRFDGSTAQTLHHFKMATGIEVTRLICYSVKALLEQNPEIKSIVKQYIQKLEL